MRDYKICRKKNFIIFRSMRPNGDISYELKCFKKDGRWLAGNNYLGESYITLLNNFERKEKLGKLLGEKYELHILSQN